MNIAKLILVAIWILLLGSFILMIGEPNVCVESVFKLKDILSVFGAMIVFSILVIVTWENFKE